MNTKLNR